MSEPVTYKKYLPICSIPQYCIISKFMTFACDMTEKLLKTTLNPNTHAPRACFHGYHELFASISGSFQDNSSMINHIWLDGLYLK